MTIASPRNLCRGTLAASTILALLLPALAGAQGPPRKLDKQRRKQAKAEAAESAGAESAPAIAEADPEIGRPLTPEEEQANKLGFYFDMTLERMEQTGHADAIGILGDPPLVPGGAAPGIGTGVDGDFGHRHSLGFDFGFRLRRNHGRIQASFFQWNERKNLLTEAPEGKAVLATLASPGAGFHEDVGSRAMGLPGPPDGLITGFEAGALSEGSGGTDSVLDGAEDVNFNLLPDFIRFNSADALVGHVSTDFQVFDLDYRRTLKRLRRFTLDGLVGLRIASATQEIDMAYRDIGSFAVYLDDEGDEAVRDCNLVMRQTYDGDGDGETGAVREVDGDGFMDGNCNNTVEDQITSVETITEDRIVARLDTAGMGLKLGMASRFELSPKWRVVGGLDVSVMSSETEYSYVESFTSERDRFLNFFDWDLNGDGSYDNRDLDFDGSCASLPVEECIPTLQDSLALQMGSFDPVACPRCSMGYVDIEQRSGAESSVVAAPTGLSLGANAFSPAFGNFGRMRRGDPVPESERNNDVLRETTILQQAGGSEDGIHPMLDLHVGMEYQFSRFASLSFGVKSRRWFDGGTFRDLANDVLRGQTPDAGGDFALDGYYLTLTVVPR